MSAYECGEAAFLLLAVIILGSGCVYLFKLDKRLFLLFLVFATSPFIVVYCTVKMSMWMG